MVKRRADLAEELMLRDGLSFTNALEDSDSDDADAFNHYTTELGNKESEVAKHFWGWDSNPAKKDGRIHIVQPGVVMFSFPYTNQAEQKTWFAMNFIM